MKKKQANAIYPAADSGHRKYPWRWMQQRIPVPVPADTREHARRSFSPQTPSVTERFIAWLRYHYIQTRWDVERSLARKLHRRWGDQL